MVMELMRGGGKDSGSDDNCSHLLSMNHMPVTVQSTFKCIYLLT